MKNLSITLVILMALGMASCANNDEKLAEGPDSSEEFLDEGAGENFDEQEVIVDEQSKKEDEQLSDYEVEESYAPEVATSGEMAIYTTQKGETLMQIAFKIYGDYRKWKDLMSWNSLNSQNVPGGMKHSV